MEDRFDPEVYDKAAYDKLYDSYEKYKTNLREATKELARAAFDIVVYQDALDTLLPSEKQEELLESIREAYSNKRVEDEAPKLPDWSGTAEKFESVIEPVVGRS